MASRRLTEISDGTIVVASVKHGQIEKGTHLEVPPDSKVVVHVNLTNGHPLEISTNSVHLALIDANAARTDERIFGVVHGAETVAVSVVSNFVVIPCCNPCELLVREQQVNIGPVLGNSCSLIVQCQKSLAEVISTSITALHTDAGFVDVVSQVDNIVNKIFAGSISVCIEVVIRIVRA